MAQALLKVSDLRTQFRTPEGVVRAVDGVGFQVDRGRVLGIVGESGSGKTITALSILRLVPQPAGRIESGQIRFDGVDLLGLSEREMRSIRGRRIGMIFQEPMTSLNPVFSIGDQIAETLRVHLKVERRAALDQTIELLRQVGIPAAERRVHDYPHQLSGGMRQRVSSAIAMSCVPRLLIADEPTTSLDVTMQAQYLELLKEVQTETGVAIILVTHDFGIVAANADRVAVMYAGKIVEMGSTWQVFNTPSHPYTQALLRCLPSVELKRQQLVEIGGQPPDLAHLPPGCPFAPRCPQRQPVCTEAYPSPVVVEDSHVAHCWAVTAKDA